METFNAVVWVVGNLMVLVIFFAAAAFCILYPLFFKFTMTTAGSLVWRAVLSLALLGGLIVIGIFVDGRVNWWQYPGDVLPWRPIIRFVIYGFIAYTFGSLVYLILVRRFWPHRLKVSPDGWLANVEPRHIGRKD